MEMDSEESVIIMVYRQIVREKIYKNQEHLRLQNQGNNSPLAVSGNGATIKYSRTIYEISGNDISVSQAGFFTQCLANSKATYTVNGLNFKDVTLKKNIGKDGVALGIAFARRWSL